MSSRLANSDQVWKLARDLGIEPGQDVVSAIIRFCERKVAAILKSLHEPGSLSELLEIVSAALGTKFEVIRSDEELRRVQRHYVNRGERAFANLEHELPSYVFGITFRLLRRQAWERPFVSIIDCRGEKAAREFFTKWHEVAHLLVLTDQLRLSFKRSHTPGHEKDPEESVIDVIAGRIGFYAPLIKPFAKGLLSFEKAEQLREELCSKASREASLNGFVAAWPRPCLLLKAKAALRRADERLLAQGTFPFRAAPVPELRAVLAVPNEAARAAELVIHPNMRVPKASVISKVFEAPCRSARRKRISPGGNRATAPCSPLAR